VQSTRKQSLFLQDASKVLNPLASKGNPLMAKSKHHEPDGTGQSGPFRAP
jgi:hypothetical protein